MKVYRGDRTLDGLAVTVDGEPLDPRTDIKQLSENGFEWSYEGPEPAQLALAMLAEHLGNDQAALAKHQAFMKAIVANFNNEWEMTEEDIGIALKNIGA
ncbi:MAG: DUF6166 domain-containing protein [Rhodovibrionaceae bacterium]